MYRLGHLGLRGGIGILAGVLALTVSGVAAPAFARQASQTGPVLTTPAAGTPELLSSTTYQQVRELKQCGGTMYAVGVFSGATQNGTIYTRNNVFSFSATAPYTMTSWAPDVNGTVNTIAFDGANCSEAYIGGNFTSVNGTPAQNISEVSTTIGAVNQAFAHSANAPVYTMAVSGSHLLTGGSFTSINGTPRDYYSSLNLTTGRDDGYLHLDISGNYQYNGVSTNLTHVYNQQVSHAGRRVLVEGDFTTAGGKLRQQIFQVFLGSPVATVTNWTSSLFNGHCATVEPFYVRAAAWSPTDGTVYVADTGNHPYLWSNTFPLTGLCDAAAAFPSTEQSVNPTWINYTGCDSLYGVVADDSAVYVGGHPRWSSNPDGCNQPGPGAIPDMGNQGLNPANGHTLLNSSGTALYTSSTNNTDDLLITSAGLWAASSNRHNSNMCDGIANHMGICFRPY